MNPAEQERQALDWVVRTNDPEFSEWDQFAEWLEQSPRNADTYHRLLASEQSMKPYLPVAVQEQPASTGPRDTQRRPMWFAAAGIAAALAAIVAPGLMSVEHVTRPGEIRVVSLGGRDQIVMNGGTRIELAGLRKRNVRLEEGQILLSLREPAAAKTWVEAGDLRLVDIGTVFEVTRTGSSTEVIVSEGAVVADPDRAQLRLETGQGLTTADGASVLKAMPIDPQASGGFARGQLIYRDQRIGRVVRDLRRSTGLDFVEDPAISALRFTGTLAIDEVKRDPRSLEPLLGVSIERSGQTWRMQRRG